MRHVPLIVLALLATACSRPPEKTPASASSTIGARCVNCHTDLTHSYRATGMAQAVGPLRPGELAHLPAVADTNTGWSYQFEEERSGARIAENWKGTRVRDAEISFAIGAGLMDRAYVARIGELQWFAPLEVVSTRSVRLPALAPGHSIRPGLRFTSPITEECLACHTDQLPPRAYPLNLRPVPGTWRPEGISCAACHGNVDSHATYQETGAGVDRMFVPNRADPIASVSLCARCHLQGDASLLLEPGARGIVPPGGDMLERRAVYVAAKPTDEIGFVSQVERLVLSQCFTASLAPGRTPLTCVTCHDPHRTGFEAAQRAVVRGKCTQCHASTTATTRECSLPPDRRGSQGCVDCHMRRTPPFDLASVEIHDHWIRKTVGPPSRIGALRAKESQDGRLAVFAWPGRARPAYADDPGLWMMALMSHGRRDLALPFADREPGPTAARLPIYHHLRGSLLEQATRLDDARAAYERALAIDPGQAETAVNLGAVLGRLGRAPSGIVHLDNVIRNHPQAEGALRNRGVLRSLRGDAAGFAADLEAAFAILPQAIVARALAQHYAGIGRDDLARRWDQAALKLQPK